MRSVEQEQPAELLNGITVIVNPQVDMRFVTVAPQWPSAGDDNGR